MASQILFAAGNDERSDELLANAIASQETPFALVLRATRRPTDETAQKLTDLNRALELAPDFVPALVLRAHTLWMEYRLDAALADAERAIALDPGAWNAYGTKAKVLLDRNRRTDALRVAEAVVTENPDQPFAYSTASQIYADLGRDAQAKEMYARFQEMVGNSPP